MKAARITTFALTLFTAAACFAVPSDCHAQSGADLEVYSQGYNGSTVIVRIRNIGSARSAPAQFSFAGWGYQQNFGYSNQRPPSFSKHGFSIPSLAPGETKNFTFDVRQFSRQNAGRQTVVFRTAINAADANRENNVKTEYFQTRQATAVVAAAGSDLRLSGLSKGSNNTFYTRISNYGTGTSAHGRKLIVKYKTDNYLGWQNYTSQEIDPMGPNRSVSYAMQIPVPGNVTITRVKIELDHAQGDGTIDKMAFWPQ